MSNADHNAWAKFRMPTWEDDISLNHNSNLPFENTIAPCEMPRKDFNLPSQLKPDLLGDRSLESYLTNDPYPIPAAEDREGYNANFNASYYLNGLSDYLKIWRAVEKYNVPVDSYLDFGCASGRVLRHFCCQSDIPHLWGTDINGRHIKWLNDYLPRRLKVIHNHCIPNLQIADNSIDVISAFSVFTHIDTFETAWLAELYRILKPGGLVYLTVQNDDSWRFLRNAGPSQMLVDRLQKRDPNFMNLLQAELPDTRLDFRHTDLGPYRAVVFHSDRYLRRTWGRFFNIAEIVPLDHGHHQSVFIGRK